MQKDARPVRWIFAPDTLPDGVWRTNALFTEPVTAAAAASVMVSRAVHTEDMRSIQRIQPGVGPAAVIELITASGDVYVVAWSEGQPILVRRHPAVSARPLWLDRGYMEVLAVAELRVGGRVEIEVGPSAPDGADGVRSAPIVAIRELDDE